MKSVCTLLGLSADAEETNVHAEVTKLLNRAKTAEEAADPLKQRITALETENKTLLDGLVEHDLAKYANRIAPEMKDVIKTALLKNRAETLAILDSVAEAKPEGTPKPSLVINRATAKTPADRGATATPEERVRLVQDYRVRNRCSFEAAWEAVRREKPELFKPEE